MGRQDQVKNPSKVVRSVDRALDILELLAEFPEGLTLTDISKQLKVPLSSVHDLMGTLLYREYVSREITSSRYRFTPKFVLLASLYRSKLDLITLAEPVMARLKEATGETSSLSILQDDMIVFIHKHPAEGVIQIVNPVGTRLPAHSTGSGKVMLAQLPDERIHQLYPNDTLPQLTEYTISDRGQLMKVLEEIRKTNYAYDEEESIAGVWAVASCIRDIEGNPVAALSVVGPRFRIEKKSYKEWHSLTLEGANEISSALGFSFS